MTRRLAPLALACALTLGGAAPCAAAVQALLVGVSDYRYLDADLRGPVNDVGLMARALLARGADKVTVLAEPSARLPEGVSPPQPPTRAAILAGLAAMAESVGPGDTAIFYFSGHGAQAPDTSGDEAGGYDEILLPADAKGWRGAIGDVENAIVDDEFQALFQAILDRGAKVVAIVDACHSATGFRAVGASVGVERFVPGAILGLPEGNTPAEIGDSVTPPLGGDFVFLYSSQSDERSFEFPLGDKADPANWYGDFTRSLAGVLTEVPDLTWAQALRAATDAMQKGTPTAVQTPDGEGTALESAVFGTLQPGQPGARRVPFQGDTLRAGLLAGFAEGALVELFDAAAGGAPVARAVLRSASADRATFEVQSGTAPATGYGVQLQPGPPAPFRLAPPKVLDTADYAPIFDAMAALTAAGLPEGVLWNAPDADAIPVLIGGTLALTGPDGVLDPAGPGSSPRMAGDAGEFLERAARVYRLRRALSLAEAAKTTGFALPGAGLTQKLEWERGKPAAGGCDDPLAGVAPFGAGRDLHDCDRLWVSLSNGSKTAQDVTVLYIDRDFNVTPLWPEPGLSNRIAFGETREIGMEIRNSSALPGQEELIVIAVPAEPGSARTVLTALADPAATRAGPGAPALQLYLEAAADPAMTNRNFGFTGALAPLRITRTRLNLVPAPR